MEVHQARRGLVLFRRIVAVGKRQWPGGIHALTTAPDPDIAPVHNGQMVVLERGNCVKWLDATAPFAELLRALPEGSLGRERVR